MGTSEVVREGRVELPRPFGHRILSPARLPFRHSRDGRTLISVDGGGGAGSERSGTRFSRQGPLSPARDGGRRALRRSAVRPPQGGRRARRRQGGGALM